MNINLLKIKIVPNKRLVLGLISLCLISALVFSVLSAFLFVSTYMDDYIGKDVSYVFQDGAYSFRSSQLHLSTLDSLKNTKGVVIVSPESFVYSFVNDQPVIIRGITKNAFALSDYFELKEGSLIDEKDFNYALVGEDLADKLNLKVNDTFVVPSSRISTFSIFKVKGVFKTYSLMDSEILIPLESVWNIDLNPKRDYYSVARVKTDKSFEGFKVSVLNPVEDYNVSSHLISDVKVQDSLASHGKNLSILGRLKKFFDYKPSAKDYIQEIVEETSQVIDREDYVEEEIEKIKEDLEKDSPIEDLPKDSDGDVSAPVEEPDESVKPDEPTKDLPDEKEVVEEDVIVEETSEEVPVEEEMIETDKTEYLSENKSVETVTDLEEEETIDNSLDKNVTDLEKEPKKIPPVSVSIKDKADVYSMLATQGFKEVIYVFAVITFIVLITGVFAVFSSVANMIFESRSELSIISKVGAKKIQISFMFLFRLFITALTASIIGVILGFVVLLGMSKLSFLGVGSSIVKPLINWQIILITILFMLLVSFMSAIIVIKKSKF